MTRILVICSCFFLFSYVNAEAQERNGDRNTYTFGFLDEPLTDVLDELAFIYKPQILFSEIEIRLDLVNILNRRNELDHFLQPGKNDSFEIHKRQTLSQYPVFHKLGFS